MRSGIEKRACLFAASLGLAVYSGTAAGSVFVGDSYQVGEWSGIIDTETYTGNGVDSKVWEYENVAFPNVYNTVIATTSRDPAWFINKYVSTTPIGGFEFRYSDGYTQEDLVGPDYDLAYVDYSTNGTTWTNVWQKKGTSAWTEYFDMNDWITKTLPASTTTLYLKHGINGSYAGGWQMFGSYQDSGVKLHEGAPGLPGDFNADGVVDAADIDLLGAAIRGGSGGSQYDVNHDSVVDHDDLDYMVSTILTTFYGDANLDRQVDVIDLGILATNWQTSGGWADADFTEDTFVDVIDLGLLASYWQAGTSRPAGAGSFQEALAAYGLPAVSVPEPAGLATMGTLAGMGVLRWRSRRRV